MFHIFSKQFKWMCIHLNFPCPNLISLHPRETALVLLIYSNWLFLLFPKIAKTFWWKSDIITATYHMTKIRDEGSKTIFLWKYFYTAQAHTGLLKISLCFKKYFCFCLLLNFQYKISPSSFFLLCILEYYYISCWILLSSIFLCRPFLLYLYIFTDLYIS